MGEKNEGEAAKGTFDEGGAAQYEFDDPEGANAGGTITEIPPRLPGERRFEVAIPPGGFLGSDIELMRTRVRLYNEPKQTETTAATGVPKQRASRQKWIQVWRYVRGMWEQGKTYDELSDWLRRTHGRLPRHPDTLREIIAAGEAGLLGTS